MSRIASRTPRNSVSDRPGRLRLLLRRQRRLIRPAALVTFAALLGSVVLIATHSGQSGASLVSLRERLGKLTASAGLRVTDVVIEGRANTPESLLRAAIGVSKGDPILAFSVEQARQRIETLSWVEHATVERRLPNTVVVFLQERRPFAIWQNQGKFVLIDRAGQIVTNQDMANFRQLPLLVGPGAPSAAAALIDALAARPSLQARVTAAVRVGERRWNLRMNNGTDIMLPEGHETAALDRLMQLQQDQSVLDRPLAAIDMRLPDRLVLRPRADAAAEHNPEPPPKKPT
ncbi:MAG: cell division protein FtsQ/DivIB [Acetobacteraceae bacterium]|nr:cell division protein FtsQ/DivIB [Acetobacteraceae bacterium]